MPRPRTVDRETVIALLNQGLKPVEIARHLNATPQAINHILHHQGEDIKTPRQVVEESIPWKGVKAEHKEAVTWRRIVNHAEYVTQGGKRMSRSKLERLGAWYRALERDNVVVEYDPNIGPAIGAKHGGWAYVPREERDGKLLLRVNEYVEMTDEAYDIWRLPERRPAV